MDAPPITLTIPGDNDFGRIVRAACANLAERAGWSSLDIGHLRSAVDLVIAGLCSAGSSSIQLDLRRDDLTLVVGLRGDGGSGVDQATAERLQSLAPNSIDRLEASGDRRTFTITKSHR